MVKKSKSTKQVRAIDRIIKFQIDDGIESLTISGKEVLADVSIDRKANVTLFLNADPDKINEIQSLVPFINLEMVKGGPETDKTKTVTLSQDLTEFALEIADNSNELATLIKTKSSIVLDLNGLVEKLLEIAGKLADLERKNQEQDEKIVAIEAKNESQDDRLNEIDVTQEAHAGKLTELERVNTEQTSKIGLLENNLATVEQNQESQGATLKDHGERITVLESLKPTEGGFIAQGKVSKDLTGTTTSFIFEGIPNESIILLSVSFEKEGVQHVFTRNWYVNQMGGMTTVLANELVDIYYLGVDGEDSLSVSFSWEALGHVIVDVIAIKKGGFTTMPTRIQENENAG